MDAIHFPGPIPSGRPTRLRLDIEVPILVILLGLLMLAAHMIRVPAPKWMSEAEEMDRAGK